MSKINFFLKPYKDIKNAEERIALLFRRYDAMVRVSSDSPDDSTMGYVSVVSPDIDGNDIATLADFTNSLGRFGSDIKAQDVDRFPCTELLSNIKRSAERWANLKSEAAEKYGPNSYEEGFVNECSDALLMFHEEIKTAERQSQFKATVKYYLVEAVNAIRNNTDTVKSTSWSAEYKQGYLAGQAYAAKICLGLATSSSELPMQTWMTGGDSFKKTENEVVEAIVYLQKIITEKYTLSQLLEHSLVNSTEQVHPENTQITGVNISDKTLFDVTVNGEKLSTGDLVELHSYYEACCTAEYIRYKYKIGEEDALELGYEVRRQMDKYGYEELEAISVVFGERGIDMEGHTYS